jgi:hypothetical protein
MALVLSVCMLAACGAALTSRDIRFSVADTPFLMRDSGAIIIGKRQVGKVTTGGKVLDNRGRVLAWIHTDSIRLRGGVSLIFKEDAEGSVYIPESPQVAAGLKPVIYRIRKNGTMARTRGSLGAPVSGMLTPRSRRLILLVVLLSNNELWR